jgi:folate-binding protein YgfZ
MTVAALAGYDAALHSLAVARRTDRARVRLTGRDPVAMLLGVITNRIPEPPSGAGTEGARGQALYAAVLTPKGRMVAELRVVRGPRGDEEGLLIETPAAALPGLLEHFGRYLPPRFARAADVSADVGHLTVAGPRAADWLARDALGLRVEAGELDALAEDQWIWVDAGGPGVLVMRGGGIAANSFDVIADVATTEALTRLGRNAGGAALPLEELDVLRIEAGRPAWGNELNAETIPPEAGIDARAIDHTKGCYTGQEVIVRIRDRGHVNRRLRGIRLGGAPLPALGTEIWAPGRDRAIGVVTSAAASPRAGAGLALGYARRELEVPAEARLGSLDGPVVQVVELGEDWWRSGGGASV